MRTLNNLLIGVFIAFAALIYLSCTNNTGTVDEQAEEKEQHAIIDVVTTTMDFKAPDTIPSGWVTLRYTNKSAMAHLALLDRMPDGYGIKDHQDSIAPFFQNVMDQINGRPLSEPGVGTTPPKWMAEVVYMGGPGFVSPGQTVQTTVRVDPGTYLLECYIKTDKVFHTYNRDPEMYGMVHQFIVTDESAGAEEPDPTITISLSTQNGLQVEGDLTPGNHVARVNYIDQKVYPNFIQHDVHLVRRENGSNIDSLLEWINWMNPSGLETPPPNGFTFLGGIQEMPAGHHGYFSFTIEPGEYIFLSEVPRPDTFGLMQVVQVD